MTADAAAAIQQVPKQVPITPRAVVDLPGFSTRIGTDTGLHHSWAMQHTSKFGSRWAAILLFPIVVGLHAQAPPARNGSIQGTVFTLENAQDRTFVPGARVRVQRADTASPGVDATTDALGRFTVSGLASGEYRVTAEFTGLEAVSVPAAVEANRVLEVAIEMKPASVKEEITVSAEADRVSVSEPSTPAVLGQSTIRNAPNSNERFETLLPLLPGVMRGPDGLLSMKGARASQGGMLLNSANVTDPVTGASGINLPIDVVSSAQVVSNPYDPEYGKMTGAVATVDTRISDFDKFHVRVQNFMPRMRKRDGSTMGIESATPRLTVTGPLVRGRVAVTQSFEYRYVRTPVETLPPLKRDTGLESFDSFTQVDLSLTERQTASVTVALYPQKVNYLGLNTFQPQEATPNLHQRGAFVALSHKLASASGSLLASQLSFKKFDSDLTPNSTGPYHLGVETTTGGYFSRQGRDTDRIEWQEVYNAHPLQARGQHQLKFGFDFVRNAFDGRYSFSPVDVLRASGGMAERIGYSPAVKTSVREREYTGFVLDRWTIHPRMTIDAGLRLDRDSTSDEGHVAPRLGLAIAPFRNARTVIRAGAGYFYDRINLNIPAFTEMPERTVTGYGANGSVAGIRTFHNRLADRLDNPRSTAWNVELEHQLRPNLLVRAGYSQRNTVRDFFLEPTQLGNQNYLMLRNDGRSRYREFQLVGRYQIGRHVVNASYVRSSAIGDLNDFNQFYGNQPNPVIRPNERGHLAFDAPNRFLFWGQFEAPWKITLSPVLDVHTGFPYSVVDDERNFIGRRNSAGRYPLFTSTDIQATKEFALPFRGKKHKAQIGVRTFNLLNHYNPRDLQADIASYRYGAFLNSVGRIIRGKFVVEF